ncbi:hypothetical protein [Actinotalea sp. JY-7876]|uniref:hypothetical protein n=1 Tax=Actinotalea sp. JY-7876 TaxID=2758442 RepID=UPI0015F5B9E6|nr:hypothetical protein [Actinotalea sp. JY-7876]
MVTAYGTEQRWPSHQKAYWREPLERARAAGWSLHYIDAPHLWGVVTCPGPEGEQHSFQVDCTASGAEFFAIEARKRVDRCKHGVLDGPPLKGHHYDKALSKLERAQELLAEAEDMLNRGETRRSALDSFEEMTATAQLTALDAAQDLELLLEQALAAEQSEPIDPHVVADLLRRGRAYVAQARRLAARVGQVSRAERVRVSAGELHRWCGRLEERLERLNPGASRADT